MAKAVTFLPVDTMLMRWVNYHLATARIQQENVDKRIHNFTSDWIDGEAIAVLLHQVMILAYRASKSYAYAAVCGTPLTRVHHAHGFDLLPTPSACADVRQGCEGRGGTRSWQALRAEHKAGMWCSHSSRASEMPSLRCPGRGVVEV